MTNLSRREFIGISFFPALVRKVAGVRLAIHDADPSHESLPESVDFPPATPMGLPGENECSECRGLGMIICPACGGTGMWTEASELAGHDQREGARAIGHCAWCDDWGEIRCWRCEGIGCTSQQWQSGAAY
jgi:hypothetical protein